MSPCKFGYPTVPGQGCQFCDEWKSSEAANSKPSKSGLLAQAIHDTQIETDFMVWHEMAWLTLYNYVHDS